MASSLINVDMVFPLLGTLVVVLLIWYWQYHWSRRNFYKLADKFPGPRRFPILGNALLVLGHPTKTFNLIVKYAQKYETMGFWLGHLLIVGTVKPEHMEIIFNSSHCIGKPDRFYKYIMPFFGSGLLTAQVHKWKRNRKIINPAFNQKILDAFVPIFVEQNESLSEILKKYEDKENFDILSILNATSIDTICESAMGVQVNAHSNNTTFGKWIDTAMTISFLRMTNILLCLDFMFNLTSLSTKFKEVVTKMQNFTQKIILDKRVAFDKKQRMLREEPECMIEEKDSKTRKIFLDHLLEISEVGGHTFTDEELLDEVLTFVMAGSDTISSTESFAFTMLGMYPEIQQKLYEEIINVVGYDRPITPEDMPKFKYMERFIKETLRLFPPVSMFGRETTEDVRLDENLVVPKGTAVAVFALGVHRSERYWKNPLEFDPDRFLPEEVAKRHPYAFLPFSQGPRNCIGYRYAMMAMKAFFCKILREYVVDTTYKSIDEIELKLNCLLRPINGFKVKIERRK